MADITTTHTRARILFFLLGVSWTGLFVQAVQASGLVLVLGTVLPALALLASAVGVLTGGAKLTSVAGKMLVAISAIAILADFVRAPSEVMTALDWVLVYALVSGLLLERISPHQRFYSWMFLAIATKVQAVLVTGVLAHVSLEQDGWYLSLYLWWSLVLAMGLGVPLLVVRAKRWYRYLVWLTTGLALLLAAYTVSTALALEPLAIATIAAATLWPIATDRLIGRIVFTH